MLLKHTQQIKGSIAPAAGHDRHLFYHSLGNQYTVNRIGGMKRIRSSVLDVLTGVLVKRQDVFSANDDYCFVIFSVTSFGSASPATTWIALQTAAGTMQASQHPF
jgi:hypothetical protein